MVAGGVQSVEEGTLYATHPTYYPQFYSTLLPPAPPGSYSSSNYSSSTYSSSGKSSDCSWLRPEGVEGAFVSSPSGRARHPRCTCPSPEAVRQARKALAARRVRASRDPRCTCPSPPGSRDASPWSGTSPSPPSTPATASPPPRHPRCTCPESDSSHRLNSNRRARSARDLRCTCPSTPTPPPSREAECTCPPQLRPHQSQPQQHQPTRRSSKGRLVHAVLLNYPGSTAISTDHGDFVRLSDSPGKITEPDVVLKAKPKKNKAKPKSKGDKSEDEDTVSTDVGEVGCVGGSEDTATPPSSPAQRVKNKLCHLRHKVVSGVAALTISRGQKDHDGRTCSCEGEGHPVRPRVRAPGVVTRILPPPPSPAADESSQDEEKGRVDENISSDQESSFPVEDLPQPILEDVCSPLGSVPPLSPPKIPFTPTIRENFFQHPLTRHLFELGSNANLTSPSTTPTKDTTTISFSRTNELRVVNPNLKQLQKLSISHGQLNGELASVMRTRSMELYVKDMTDQTLKLPRQQRIGGSVCHLAAGAPNIPSHIEPQVVRKILPQSPSRLHSGNDSSQFSTPCLSSGTLTCFSTSQNTLKVSDYGATEKMQSRLRKHPDYENVAFHNSGEYVMLSKKLLDQWQLSYDACLPPEGTLVVTDSEGIATLQNDLPSVSCTESGQVSSITPLKKQDLEKVALPLCPSTSVLLPICPPTSHISFGGQNTSTMLPPSPITTRPVGSLATYTTDVLHSSLPPLPSTSLAYLPPFSTFSSASSPTPPPPPTPPLTTFTSSSSFPLPEPPSTTSLAEIGGHPVGGVTNKEKAYMTSPRRARDLPIPQPGHFHSLRRDSLKLVKKEDLWMPRSSLQSEARSFRRRRASDTTTSTKLRRGSSSSTSQLEQTDDGDTDQETDRLLGQQRSDDPGFYDEKDKETNKKKGRSKEVLIEGVLFRARYLGSTQLVSEGQPTKTTRMMQAEEAVSRIKALAPDGETQPSTEVDLFISTEKIMVLNTDLKEIMMDHALRTISYIADIGDLVVLMARRRVLPTDDTGNNIQKTPKMICHVFESDEAQFIAQSIGQAFQVAYLEFLKANGIEDHSFVKEMDYQEVLNSQEIFGDELQMFAKKELQKEVVVPKMKSEILGVVVVESGWGSMVPTVVIANLSPTGAAAKCGQLNIGDQIIAINGVSLVGLPLSTCQNYIKNTKYNTAVKLTVVPCPPVVEVKIRRPDTKYQLGFSVQNGVICSLLRGGIAERGGVRVGHRIIDINSQSVVAVPHEKIVNLLATSVGEIRMKTMPTSIFRLLTGQETPQYI